eukprot:TRINITY_DN120_c0_g1_i1.p1 TRINITY_DN120_c0_g1~~TRINITY_DN120_c0_g1_i1.p1  ORF type:complete len:298 (-),score=39.22 TRINITY_DN120_c0_g1_i1:117-1010(-)
MFRRTLPHRQPSNVGWATRRPMLSRKILERPFLSVIKRRISSDPSASDPVGLYEVLPRYPDFSAMGVLRFLDYLGTASFAVSGCLCAATAGLDLIGCIFVGGITALGGGSIRDCLFGRAPVFWLEEREYMHIAVVCAALTFIILCFVNLEHFWLYEAVAFWSDTIGLGAFAVIGTMYALRLRYPPSVVLLCTLVTCTGGGLIRDTLCRRPARVLYPFQETYAICAVAGSATFVLLRALQVLLLWRTIISVGTVIALRCLAAKTHFTLPVATAVLASQHRDAPELEPVDPHTERAVFS